MTSSYVPPAFMGKWVPLGGKAETVTTESPVTHAIPAIPAMPVMPVKPPMPPVHKSYKGYLCMASVDKQEWNEIYEPEVGFERGTIFPALDLPFTGEGAYRYE